MRVSVVGAGYVGLVSAACLADLGHDVVCADVDASKIEQIQAGSAPIYEAGLDDLVARTGGVTLHATTDVREAVRASDLTLLAVGTPSVEDGIDLSAIVSATRAIGLALTESSSFHVVAVKSTVVPGTTDGVILPLLEEVSARRAGVDFGVGVNPEFLTEGQAVADFMAPDRLVLGAMDERTYVAFEELYAAFPDAIPRLWTNTRTAEMIKYASNALLATMISFANEIGNLCAAVGGVDVVDVMRAVHLSNYLTSVTPEGEHVEAAISSFLEAGCGFGGSCLPKDVRALAAEGERLGRPMRVLRAVLETNDAQPDELVRVVERTAGGLRGRSVAVLGLAFKPGTDDVRESPAIPVVRRLLEREAHIVVHDPVVTHVPDELSRSDVVLTSDLDDAIRGAEVVVLVTRWEHYRDLPARLAELDAPPLFIDGRRMLERDTIPRYWGIGLS